MEAAEQPADDGDEDVEEDLSVQEYIALLDSGDAASCAAAAESIAAIVGEAFGEDGAALGKTLRESGIVAKLAHCVSFTTAEVRAHALLALGNLCSDAVDPRSSQTKSLLLDVGLERSLMTCVAEGEEPSVMLVAAATLQNLCHDGAWAARIVAIDGSARLEALLGHADERVIRYASGALKNLTLLSGKSASGRDIVELSASASHAVRQREHEAQLEEFTRRRARRVLGRGVGAMDAPRRLGRLLEVPVDDRGVAWLDAVEACHVWISRRIARIEAGRGTSEPSAELRELRVHKAAAHEAYDETLGMPVEELVAAAWQQPSAGAGGGHGGASGGASGSGSAGASVESPAEEVEEEEGARLGGGFAPSSPIKRTHILDEVDELLEVDQLVEVAAKQQELLEDLLRQAAW